MQTPRILPKKKNSLHPQNCEENNLVPKITYIKSKYTETRIMNQFHTDYCLCHLTEASLMRTLRDKSSEGYR